MRRTYVLLLASFCGAPWFVTEAQALPPPIQPSFCGPTMCVVAAPLSVPGRGVGATFQAVESSGVGEIRISYETLGSVSFRLDEAGRAECERPTSSPQPQNGDHFSYFRMVSIPKPFLRYRGALCRRLIVTVAGTTPDAAKLLARSVPRVWLLADSNVYLDDGRHINMPYDAVVHLLR